MYDICTYIYHQNQANVGKYTSSMDPMGQGSRKVTKDFRFLWLQSVCFFSHLMLEVVSTRPMGLVHLRYIYDTNQPCVRYIYRCPMDPTLENQQRLYVPFIFRTL